MPLLAVIVKEYEFIGTEAAIVIIPDKGSILTPEG